MRAVRCCKGGVEVVEVPPEDGAAEMVNLREGLRVLAGRGITRLLVEGGGRLAATLLDLDLIDEIYNFRAGLVIGASGKAGIGPLKQENLNALQRFDAKMILQCDKDCLEVLTKPD